MEKSSKRKIYAAVLIAIVAIAIGSFVIWYLYPKPTSAPTTLILIWQSGPEPDLVAETFNWYTEEFPEADFTLVADIPPRDVARLKLIREMTEKRNDYQLLGAFLADINMLIENDMYEPLENLLPESLITKVKNNLPSFLLDYISKDGKTYVLPIYWNSLCLFYRTDLFNDPEEKANFKEKYGYDLRPPETWQEFCDVAEFFTRPEEDLWGYALSGVAWALFYNEYVTGLSCGGLWPFVDFETKTTNVNSPEGAKLLEMLAKLAKCSPPGWENGDWFTFGDKLFAEGKVAMWHNWYYPWPAFNTPEASAVVGKVGVSHFPTINTSVTPLTWLSGGGIGVNKYATPEQKAAAAKYLEWLLSDRVQERMYLTGELFIPARIDILQKPTVQEKLNAQPFLELAEEVEFYVPPSELSEVWEMWVPEVAEALHSVVRGEMTPQEAANFIADRIEAVLSE